MRKNTARPAFVTYALLIMVLCLGFFLRAQETISGNFLFLLDSGRDMMDVRSIVFEHKPTLIGPYTSLGGVFQGPFYYYLLAIPTALFRGNPWGNILLMLIWSLLVMYLAYRFTKTYFGLIPAVITFTLFAFSPEAIAAATYFWNPHPMWLILVSYIFLLYGAVTKQRLAAYLIWPVVTLSFSFEMALGVFLGLATLIVAFFGYNKALWKNKAFWIGLGISVVWILPTILFELRHDFLMTKSVLALFGGGNRGLATGGEQHAYMTNMILNWHVIRENYVSSYIHGSEYSYFPAAITITAIASFAYGLYRRWFTRNELVFMRTIIAVTGILIVFSVVYPFPLRYWFLTGFQSFYLVLTGLSLSKLWKVTWGKVLLILLFGVILVHTAFRLDRLYMHPPDDGGHAKIKGKLAAIDYIYQDAEGKPFNLFVFTPPVLTDAYDYLVWWHGNRTYGYAPGNEKSGFVYLLMEPDPSKPWSYKGWLETVIKTGTVMSTKTLQSGLIVEKRMME